MWLLDTDLGTFLHVDRPREHRFAILSHVWRAAGEQTFQDLKALQDDATRSARTIREKIFKRRAPTKPILDRASEKISGCCALARRHGYRWVWIDSCCIDKTSSTELSEAINSMYEWYAAAEVCFAYLDDVEDDHDPQLIDSKFRRSRWFTRGWTLQELLAPGVVVFFSKTWSLLGTKESLADLVQEITGIDREVLTHMRALDSVSVARRMSWASKRQTTREEDRAYSLMGLFGVNMPTIYGEGANAFIRLQEEILKHVPDQSIFVWGPILYDDEFLFTNLTPHTASDDSRYWQSRNILAWSPDAFVNSAGISSASPEDIEQRLGLPLLPANYTFSSFGMCSRFPLVPINHGSGKTTYLSLLACEDTNGRLLALLLYPQRMASGQYYVGHYVGRPQVPPYAYFRAVTLSGSRCSALLGCAKVEDVCIPYRQSLRRTHASNPLISTPTFTCPCDVVIPGWIISKLRKQGFSTTVEAGGQDFILHVTETTPSFTRAITLRSNQETIQIHMGRCPCLGRFLYVSVSGNGSSGLQATPTASSEATLAGSEAGLPSSSSARKAKKEFAIPPQDMAARCPSGHVAAWSGGSKEYVYGLRKVRLKLNAWMIRQDIYTLEVELDEIQEAR